VPGTGNATFGFAFLCPINHDLSYLEFSLCLFSTRRHHRAGYDSFVMTKEGAMKALTLLTAAALTLLSVASGYAQTGGYYYGKGKAPPPPVVTKG
jgi:hypothetical protein